ncbi:hypothetical protein Pfo_026740, partial [Paulownia fortunei]
SGLKPSRNLSTFNTSVLTMCVANLDSCSNLRIYSPTVIAPCRSCINSFIFIMRTGAVKYLFRNNSLNLSQLMVVMSSILLIMSHQWPALPRSMKVAHITLSSTGTLLYWNMFSRVLNQSSAAVGSIASSNVGGSSLRNRSPTIYI